MPNGGFFPRDFAETGCVLIVEIFSIGRIGFAVHRAWRRGRIPNGPDGSGCGAKADARIVRGHFRQAKRKTDTISAYAVSGTPCCGRGRGSNARRNRWSMTQVAIPTISRSRVPSRDAMNVSMYGLLRGSHPYALNNWSLDTWFDRP